MVGSKRMADRESGVNDGCVNQRSLQMTNNTELIGEWPLAAENKSQAIELNG